MEAVAAGGRREGGRTLDSASWRERLAPYAKPDLRRSALDVATSVAPYVALTALMYVTLNVSLLLTLTIAVPAAGFLVRTFIVFHDCAHGSFLRSRRGNVWLGTACGLLVYSPFHSWRHEHAVHHATSGDLDRRGKGDVETLTVAEYAAMSPSRRHTYRLFGNPLVMLGLGPIWTLLLEPRLVPGWARARYGRKIIATDVALAALVGGLCAVLGWRAVVLVQLPTAMLAGARARLAEHQDRAGRHRRRPGVPVAAPEVDASAGRELQIAGPDILSYGEMLDVMARALGKAPPAEDPRPVRTPWLSSLWTGLVTPVDAGVAPARRSGSAPKPSSPTPPPASSSTSNRRRSRRPCDGDRRGHRGRVVEVALRAGCPASRLTLSARPVFESNRPIAQPADRAPCTRSRPAGARACTCSAPASTAIPGGPCRPTMTSTVAWDVVLTTDTCTSACTPTPPPRGCPS